MEFVSLDLLFLCIMFCRSLFVLLFFLFWPLCCLSFDLRIMITPLVSSNSSVIIIYRLNQMLNTYSNNSSWCSFSKSISRMTEQQWLTNARNTSLSYILFSVTSEIIFIIKHQDYVEFVCCVGAVVVVIVLDLQLPIQSVPITTDVVSSNLHQGEVYNIMW